MPAVFPEARRLLQGRRRPPCRARLRSERGARAGGEWRVEKQRLRWDVLDAFAAAAEQAGIPRVDDFNRGDNEGVGYFDVNQRAGIRWNATKAFLRPILHRRQPAGVDRCAHRAHRARRRRPGPRRTDPAGQPRRADRGDAEPGRRDRSCHRRDRHAADPAALGHRRAVAVAGERHHRAQSPSRRRRKPAGPPADPRCLRRRRCAHAQHSGQLAMGQGDDRPRIRVQAKRADEHGAVAARCLHEEPAGAGPRRSRVPRAAALARCLRRAAACVQRLHRQRLQPESDEPRPGPDPLAKPARRAAHRARTICRPKPTH